MTPFMSRINDRIHPLVERLGDQQRALREKGTDLLANLQERHEKLFDRGQRAISHFEETVLERVGELLTWADARTNGRSDALKRTADFVADRLAELREESDEEAEAEDKAAATAGDEEKPAPAQAKPAKKSAEKKEAVKAPFENYDKLNVKKLAARFNDLSEDQLRLARAYEEANKGRKTVFDAIDRLLG